ncbi:LCP family protein [Nitriliruptor alkaliphilus]|uniref:LCP family protein n=1 Tax=Nitriliruptor alkaliphilus TaxID=427918 RepID=UPI000697E76A|nr:LCP family protein [Nitriliruptor alkaliphilus]
MTGSRSLTFSTARRPQRRRWVRVVVGLLIVALLAVVLLALSGGLLWAYAWARLGGTELPSLAAEGDEALGAGGATSPEGTTTVLIALTPPRDATDPAGVPLAGPVALVQVGGPRGDDAAVLVLPSQLPVSVEGEAPMTLAQVHAAGGPDVLLRTVVDYTEIDVDHVVIASETTLPQLVEALGPIEVCTTGCTTVDHAQATTTLAGLLTDDAAPADVARALDEVAALLRGLGAATDPVGAITSPLASKRVIDIIAADVTTDANLRGGALLPLAEQLSTTGAVAIVQLPGVVNPDTGRLLVLPEQAATRFAVLREGGVPEASADDDEAAFLAAATVSVQNGTGTAGYAADLEAQLSALGVRVVGTENAPTFDVERTQVIYGPDDPAVEAAAILIARELGDVDLVADERQPTFEGEPVSIRVIGGADLDTGGGS